ncbi:MAG: TetR/AcrR family transcriptional regulator [Promethearchaeota archaeon]
MSGSNDRNTETKAGAKLTRRERKTLRTRQQILDAARELFNEYPYDDVKMDDIAEQADLSRATLYNHFDSKEDIYFEIGIQGIRTISKKQGALFKSESSSGLDKIVKLSEATLRYLFENPLIHEIMRHYLVTESKAEITTNEILRKMKLGEDVENPSDRIRARFLQEIRKFEKPWAIAVEQGFKDGSIHQDMNPDHLVHFLFMIISGIVDRANLERVMMQKVNLSVEDIIKRTIDLIRKDLESD